MGSALRVFLWLWQEGQAGPNPWMREVRAGGCFRAEEVGQALGINERTVRRHLTLLCRAGYLTTWREPHGFSAVVNLGRARQAQPPAGPDNPVRSVGGEERPDRVVRSVGPERTRLSDHACPSPDRAVRSGHPPAPPLVEEDLFLDLYSPGGFFKEPTTAKRARPVPTTPGREAPSQKPAAVADGSIAGGSRSELAIARLLGRIEAWERPEMTRTLLETLGEVPVSHLDQVFELVWRMHRTRRKDLDNPAGWWAAMLQRAAEQCVRSLEGRHGYG